MLENTVVTLRQPGSVDDVLTDLLRDGARQLLAQAIEMEVEVALSEHAHLRTDDGRRRLVRHGHGPEAGREGGPGSEAVPEGVKGGYTKKGPGKNRGIRLVVVEKAERRRFLLNASQPAQALG